MSYNNVEISKMNLDDFNDIKNILISDFDDFWKIDTFEEELKNNNSYYLVGKINNEIVGFAGIKIVLDEADIMNVVTRKTYRNQGIGSIILEKLISYAKQNGIKKLTVEVNEQNLSAIHLYKKFNFKEIALRKNYYNNTYNAIIMQLAL